MSDKSNPKYCYRCNRLKADHPKVWGIRFCETVFVEEVDGKIVRADESDQQRTKANNKRYISEERFDKLTSEQNAVKVGGKEILVDV